VATLTSKTCDWDIQNNRVVFTANAYAPAQVTTYPVSAIAQYDGLGGGTITNDGGSPIIARGLCWSTDQNPDITDNTVPGGTGSGTFAVSITSLEPGQLYYVRAYAANAIGVYYGNQVSFTTLAISVPAVTTIMISNIAASSATGGGVVSADGGESVTARGLCWSTTSHPTVSNSNASGGSGLGSFTSSLTGLNPATTYYVRAYATNSTGTAYGNEVSFTTPTTQTLFSYVAPYQFDHDASYTNGTSFLYSGKLFLYLSINNGIVTGTSSTYWGAGYAGTVTGTLSGSSMTLNISADTVVFAQNNTGTVSSHFSENWAITGTVNSDHSVFNGTVTLNVALTSTSDPSYNHTYTGTISYP